MDYGPLRPLLRELTDDDGIDLQLLVTGMHLSPEFGLTIREIETDGFPIAERVEILLSSDTPVGTAKSMGLGLIGFAEAFQRLTPDIVVCQGDRYEIFCAAAAALITRIPVAHIGGGDITEGAFDDALRHAISKMSHLHFVALEEHRQRLLQMGEDPAHVFRVGELGLDTIAQMEPLSREALENQLGITFQPRNLLVTFHPATLDDEPAEQQFQILLKVLAELPDTGIVFTKVNADPAGRAINRLIDRFVAAHPATAAAFHSLGSLQYLSLMRQVDAVVGNSSSGIVEAPSLGIGTINIGSRQQGRLQAASIISCPPRPEPLRRAFATLYSPAFQARLKEVVNPYGDGRAAPRIARLLREISLDGILWKRFHPFPPAPPADTAEN